METLIFRRRDREGVEEVNVKLRLVLNDTGRLGLRDGFSQRLNLGVEECERREMQHE